jgi:6-methylsalicylate decarboxylase
MTPITTQPPLYEAIDVHAHFLPPRLRDELVATGHTQPDGMAALPHWDTAAALSCMDATGISAAILSISSPGVLLDGRTESAVALARSVNEDGAAVVGAYPHRFGLFASLPLPDVTAALHETRYALDHLGADGVVLMTNYAGAYLGDPAFEPLMAELNTWQAVVHIHPTSPACWEHTALGRPRPMLEFLFDTTRAVTNLVLNGVLDRHPDIRFIVAHAGAALPVLADRVAGFAIAENPDAPVDVLAALRRLYYDVAGFALPRALPALLELVDGRRLLYGSDFPFTAEWIVQGLATQLAAAGHLTDDLRSGLQRTNARDLFPRLAQRQAIHDGS